MSTSALFATLMAVVGWGGGAICDKLAVRDLSALGVLLVRSMIAVAALSIWGAAAGVLREVATIGFAPVAWIIAGSLSSQVFGQFMYYRALKVAPVSQVVPVTASFPLVTVALAMIFLGEKMTGAKLLGVVFIVVGIVLVAGVGRNGP